MCRRCFVLKTVKITEKELLISLVIFGQFFVMPKKDRLWRQAAKDNRQKLLERFPDARKDWDEDIYEVDEVEWEQAAEAGWEVVATERSNPLRTRREVPGTLSATAPTPEGPFADTLIAAGLTAPR